MGFFFRLRVSRGGGVRGGGCEKKGKSFFDWSITVSVLFFVCFNISRTNSKTTCSKVNQQSVLNL